MNNWKKKLHQFSLVLLFAVFVFFTMLLSMLLVFSSMNLLVYFGLVHYPSDAHQPLLLFALVSLFVGTFMAIFIGNRPLKPWYELTNAADEIANGNYTVRVHTKGPEAVQELNQSFNHMAEELASVELLRTDFINNFSHEFKTPIVSIRGFAKMLKRSDLTQAEQQEYLNIIINESERLADLANNVLNLSKIEQQTILTNKKQFNISEQIRLVIAMMMSKWSKKPFDIAFESDEIYLVGNEEMLKQVWINLLDNAIKFSSDHSAIKIRILKEEKGLSILVRDHGPGMDPETRQHIFDKFYQGDPSRTSPGNGLGLTIVKQIISLHTGTIQVESTSSLGTTFRVFLPYLPLAIY